MRAFRGIVVHGKVQLQDDVKLPEGAVVTVTIGEAEYIRATLRQALRRNVRRRSRGRVQSPALPSAGSS